MDYRDWGSGELSRRVRQHDAREGGLSDAPAEEGARRAGRRNLHSAERYVPAWARDDADIAGGGRHRQEDTDEAPPARRARWQTATETTGGWQREPEPSSWTGRVPRQATGREPVSPTGAGWGQQETRSVGRRRAREDDDRGGAHRASPAEDRDRPYSAQPVTGVGGWEPPTSTGGWGRGGGTGWEDSTSAGNWAASLGADRRTSRPPGDSRSGREGRGRDSRRDPATDWERSPAVDPWARPDDTSTNIRRWDQAAGDFTASEPRSGPATGGRSIGRATPRSPETDGPEQRYGRRDTFWSGTRLAGDDPRWMDTPAAAPSSPVVGYPRPGLGQAPPAQPPGFESAGTGIASAPAPRGLGGPATGRSGAGRSAPARRGAVYGGAGRPAAAATAPRGTATASRSAARPAQWGAASVGLSRMPARLDSGLLIDGDRGSMSGALLCTVAWYALPVLVLFGWLVTLDGSVPDGCVTDVTGGGCQSPRTHALVSLLAGVPQFGAALLASLVVAVLLRRASGAWRSVTVGLAAAVVGGGLSTVLFTALSGTG
ncbi:hypothetical protein ACFFWC_03480 [Plantactinospora siamensis]|uniref:Yip1 domain-containing protein n=1 Tax=Plantactinospora siamensis TaxID=555372 RepID=A0ABV6NSJ1_9ACTN